MSNPFFDPFDLLDELETGMSIFRMTAPDSDDFRIIYSNVATDTITGYELSTSNGHSLLELIPEASDAGFLTVLKDVIQSGIKQEHQEFELPKPNGKASSFYMQVKPYRKDMVIVSTEKLRKMSRSQEELIIKNKQLLKSFLD